MALSQESSALQLLRIIAFQFFMKYLPKDLRLGYSTLWGLEVQGGTVWDCDVLRTDHNTLFCIGALRTIEV